MGDWMIHAPLRWRELREKKNMQVLNSAGRTGSFLLRMPGRGWGYASHGLGLTSRGRQLEASCLLSLVLVPWEVSLDLFAWGEGVSGREPALKVRAPAAEASPLSTFDGPSFPSMLPNQAHASIPSLPVAAGRLWASQGLEADK